MKILQVIITWVHMGIAYLYAVHKLNFVSNVIANYGYTCKYPAMWLNGIVQRYANEGKHHIR